MRLNLGTASLLSFLFIIEAAAISAIVTGAAGLVQISMIDPRAAAIVVAGVGIILAFFILYKNNP